MAQEKVYYDKSNIYITDKQIKIGDNKYVTAQINPASVGIVANKYGAVIAFFVIGIILATLGFAGGKLKACGSIALIMFGAAAVMAIGAKNKSFSLDEGEGGAQRRMREFIWRPAQTIASGIYIVKARTEDGGTASKRVVYIR